MKNIKLFFQFFKIAFFTLGGGYAILPVMRNHFVVKTALLQDDEFQEYLSLVQGMPGSLAVNCATFIGYRLNGAKGALVAVTGSVMPSLLVITIISYYFAKFASNPFVVRFFMGIRPAVVALILYFAYTMMKRIAWAPIKIILLAFFLLLFLLFRINPIILIIVGTAFGLLYSWLLVREVQK